MLEPDISFLLQMLILPVPTYTGSLEGLKVRLSYAHQLVTVGMSRGADLFVNRRLFVGAGLCTLEPGIELGSSEWSLKP